VSDEELIRGHDHIAKTTGSGVSYYLEELAGRDQQKATETMDHYTRSTRDYTRWITSDPMPKNVVGIDAKWAANSEWLRHFEQH
jgi:hypothetical protein